MYSLEDTVKQEKEGKLNPVIAYNIIMIVISKIGKQKLQKNGWRS